MVKVYPSILASDFSRLADEIAEVEAGGADGLHVDVMDGHYVPNITMGPVIVNAVGKSAHVPFDVDLMITDPLHYAQVMVKAGPHGFFFHPDTVEDPEATIEKIKGLGVAVGISVNPDEKVSSFLHLFGLIDHCLVMTVFPGFGGQEFMESALDNVKAARDAFEGDVAVDGGVSPETAGAVARAGGTVLIAGTAVFGHKDRAAAIRDIKAAAEAEG